MIRKAISSFIIVLVAISANATRKSNLYTIIQHKIIANVRPSTILLVLKIKIIRNPAGITESIPKSVGFSGTNIPITKNAASKIP
ncbi:hypothetical protein SDC9_198198 [bioreactor metagenome]|uniref:Uncharacterized protein n=1 Tax=bioreactor metagenome TaxID=1076179 RepID=A0A645IGZ7_9ZZZZ